MSGSDVVNVLIVGASGFLGSSVLSFLLEHPRVGKIIVLRHLTTEGVDLERATAELQRCSALQPLFSSTTLDFFAQWAKRVTVLAWDPAVKNLGLAPKSLHVIAQSSPSVCFNLASPPVFGPDMSIEDIETSTRALLAWIFWPVYVTIIAW